MTPLYDDQMKERISLAVSELAEELVIEEQSEPITTGVEETTESTIDFGSLFYTPEGKKLAENISELIGFITPSTLLSLPLDKIVTASMQFWTSPEFEEVTADSVEGEQDKNRLRLFRDFLRTNPDVLQQDITFPIFKEKDMGRFFALLILSLSAYLDHFVESLMKHVLTDVGTCHRMVKVLEKKNGNIIRHQDLYRYPKNPSKALSKIINRYAPRNAAAKLDFILQGLQLNSFIDELVSSFDMDYCRNDISRFLDIRERVAHYHPHLNLDYFRESYGDIRLERMKEAFLSGLSDIPQEQLANPIVESIVEILTEFQGLFTVTYRVSLMALCYAALVDRVVSVVFNFTSKSSDSR